MSGMPERIWLDGRGRFRGVGVTVPLAVDDAEYIRSDLYATLEAENAELKAKLAKADELAKAMKVIASKTTPIADEWGDSELYGIATTALAAYKEDKR